MPDCEPVIPGTFRPVAELRATEIVALPSTTSAMLRPTLPPIRKVGDIEVRSTLAAARPAWVQSRTVPVLAETLFNWNTSPVPMILTTSTPCNCALPREPSKPVNFRATGKVV